MSIGKQPFNLPINAVKKETSFSDKVLIQSHNEDATEVAFFDSTIDRRIHTQSVKIKFFVVGYRLLTANEINYVGRWVELEPYQLDYLAVTTDVPATYFLGFYPYVNDQTNELHIRLQLFPFPNNSQPGEIYIEKLTIIDSDFDASLSWLTDEDIPPIIPPITGPVDPTIPVIPNPDPNNIWPFGKD